MVFRPDTNRPATLARRDALLDAAIALIGERGPSSLTHRAIAAKAGLPPATTSYFFASIDELVIEAMRRLADNTIALLQAAATQLTENSDPQEAIDRLINALLATPETATIAQLETYLEAARRPELQQHTEGVLDALEDYVRTTMQTLGFKLPQHAARAAVALTDGFALHRLAGRHDDEHLKALRDALLTQLGLNHTKP